MALPPLNAIKNIKPYTRRRQKKHVLVRIRFMPNDEHGQGIYFLEVLDETSLRIPYIVCGNEGLKSYMGSKLEFFNARSW